MFITITLESPDGLGRETWRFRIDTRAGESDSIPVKLVYWANETRPTRRHKWQIVGKHFNTYNREFNGPENAPEVPAHVWHEFKDQLFRRLVYAGTQG